MDKSSKLQRYDRKKYEALVDFPVEIVGRDGVVRRYGFEDSVRLYQRRIGFAASRIGDPELRRAEISHCRARIDQLRRSYYRRHGWGTPPGEPDAEDLFGDLAGELAAFLVRFLKCDGRPELRFQPVEQRGEEGSTWYVVPAGAPSGLLLTVHRFDVRDDRARERFFASLHRYRLAARGTGDDEELLAFHHTVDCGFVLRGRSADFAHLARLEPEGLPEPTPWDVVGRLVRCGEHERALRACTELVREQPWHRKAYVGGAMLALLVGRDHEAEALALLGSRFFPEDGALKLYLGVARGVRGDGLADLRAALALDPELDPARLLLVAAAVRAGRLVEVLRLLRGAREVPDRAPLPSLQLLEAELGQSAWTAGLGLLLLAVGLLAMLANGWLVVGVAAQAVGVALVGVGVCGMQCAARDAVARFQRELPRGLRRLLGSDTPGPVAH